MVKDIRLLLFYEESPVRKVSVSLSLRHMHILTHTLTLSGSSASNCQHPQPTESVALR